MATGLGVPHVVTPEGPVGTTPEDMQRIIAAELDKDRPRVSVYDLENKLQNLKLKGENESKNEKEVEEEDDRQGGRRERQQGSADSRPGGVGREGECSVPAQCRPRQRRAGAQGRHRAPLEGRTLPGPCPGDC